MQRFEQSNFSAFLSVTILILCLSTAIFADVQDNVRVNNGATSGQINVGSYCRTVTNNAGTAVYIPADHAASWNDLVANNRFPSGVTANSCCTPNSYVYCPTGGGSTYWYDSCNNQGAEYDSCGYGYVPQCIGNDRYHQTGGCTQGTSSCTIGFHYSCPTSGYLCDGSNQLNPYQGCSGSDCSYGAPSGCPTSGYYCDGNDRREYAGCPAWTQVGGCSSNFVETCAGGCSGGACNPTQTCGNAILEGTEVCEWGWQEDVDPQNCGVAGPRVRDCNGTCDGWSSSYCLNL